MQYVESYDITPTAANNQQSEIDASHPVDLYAQYDGFGENLSLSLGVNNVFNEDPPHYNGISQTTFGHVGGNLGRVVYLGLNKRF